ncbi:folylpolyglutamate synthase/dihydrofolate synthase family protein [Sebaldella sp. S0638]|uniref:bifunctional folylpolyglutamate synthase/dihydrofolate synthase n=1 Tax=Sebaldella sp. S0638 TaxID=2957809 RepID=UPI00209CB7AF|nr:folylpolyglutamate synthase/dihydrofolate synthase family protein [Sebaldella sp. S0638]MCP1223785.1 bifunctional folylpolyglutamate synthase/dihydrofolate synthase [Sebaldella sp. S0638]
MDKKKNLDSVDKFKIKLGLENMEKAMKSLGNPEKNYKIIHIAGTNGKGSAAAFLEAGLLAAGYRTGKYTSPEIYRFNERITVNGIEINDEDVDIYYEKINKVLEENNIELTYFEVTTAMMFLYMKEKNIDYLVLETGLGGRTDATNTVAPVISLITNISFDHMEFLGNTLREIAHEKAGIIKKDVPVFFSDSKQELLLEIKAKTDNYVNVLEKYNFNNESVELDKKKLKTIVKINGKEFRLSLFGKFQGKNFLLAYEALRYLGIDDEIITKSCLKAVWQGRFQIISENPFIILDGAHNKDSAAVLSENLAEVFPDRELVFIISILKDKDNDSVLEELAKASDYAVFTGINNNRGQNSEEMYNRGKDYFEHSYAESTLESALEKAESLNKKAVVICGSFFLLKEYKKSDI